MSYFLWIAQAAQDVRCALRQFRSSQAFTLAVTLSLACGIGANTASFSAINSLLLKSLPVPNPDQMIQLDSVNTREGNTLRGFSYPGFEILRKAGTAELSGMFAYTTSDASSSVYPALSKTTMIYEGNAAIAKGMLASGGIYKTLGVEPALGRLFAKTEDRVAVLSYNCWRSRFGGNPAIIGRTVIVNQIPLTVIGVTPPEFRGLELGYSPDFTAPLSVAAALKLNSMENGGEWWLGVFARKKPGFTNRQVQIALAPAFRQTVNDLVQSVPSAVQRDIQKMVSGLVLAINPANQGAISSSRDELRRGLQYLSAMVILLLAIACVNIASLILARTASRQPEIRIRLSLGASRARVFRQLLTETMLLTCLGCLLALPLAWAGAPLLISAFSDASIAGSLNLTPDWRVFLFSFTSAAVCGLFLGAVPWLSISKPVSKNERGQDLLMGSQVALALLLVAAAALLVRSFQNIRHIDPGFRPDKVVAFTIEPPEASPHFSQDLTERLHRLVPGGLVSFARFAPARSAMGTMVRVGTRQEPVGVNTIAPGYLETVGIRLLRGRSFDALETRPSAIVNQSFMRRYFNGTNPLSKTFTILGDDKTPIEIVGVVQDVKEHGLLDPVPLMIYLPCQPSDGGDVTFFVRTQSDPSSLIPAIQREVKRLNPAVPITDISTLNLQLSQSVARERALALGSSTMGLLALALASIGIYGMISYRVSRETRSIGIRMALGARPADIFRAVIRRVSLIVAAGIVLGLACVFSISRYLKSILFGLSAIDPAAIAAAAAILTAVAFAAAYLPARRAANIDPARCLRNE